MKLLQSFSESNSSKFIHWKDPLPTGKIIQSGEEGSGYFMADGKQVIDKFGDITPFSSGSVYYVDGNSGDDTNSGLSWEKPFKTLAYAFGVSHTDIARGSDRRARRNRIYIAGDRFIETLVAFPQKTDVIGVGSCDNFPRACIRGNHAPVNTAVGTRFYNVQFEPTTAADIITLTSATTGVEVHNCDFEASGALIAVSAIDVTGHTWFKSIGCTYSGAFTGPVIDIGAGAVDGMVIQGNTIQGGANDGIEVTGATTVTTGRMGLIADNYIQVATFVILDGNDNTFNIVRNRCISAGAETANAYEIDEGLAVDNVITYNDGTSVRVPIIPSS